MGNNALYLNHNYPGETEPGSPEVGLPRGCCKYQGMSQTCVVSVSLCVKLEFMRPSTQKYHSFRRQRICFYFNLVAELTCRRRQI